MFSVTVSSDCTYMKTSRYILYFLLSYILLCFPPSSSAFYPASTSPASAFPLSSLLSASNGPLTCLFTGLYGEVWMERNVTLFDLEKKKTSSSSFEVR